MILACKKHKGSAGPWALFWALKKALKRVNPLKKALLRANPLFWVLKKVFKKVSLIKRALKKVLLWVINSKWCSKKSGLLKRVKFQSFAQKRAHLSWTPQKILKRVGCTRNWTYLSDGPASLWSSGHQRFLSCISGDEGICFFSIGFQRMDWSLLGSPSESGQWIHWCDLGLRGWSVGWGPQG